MERALSFRPIGPGDEEILERIYASTRAEELQAVDWSDSQKQAFVQMQFTAQHRFYQEQFPQAAFEVILVDTEPAGRLYVDRRPDEIRLVDIALLPTYRGLGIGSGLLTELCKEASEAGKPLRIHVEQQNPALRLYERLGFRGVGENGVYFLMEWTPTPGA